jgi:hypothetical protein
MNFLEAMAAVNEGASVARQGWAVSRGSTLAVAKSTIWSSFRGSGGPPASGAEMIATLKQTNDTSTIGDQPFVPTQADILGCDWIVMVR